MDTLLIYVNLPEGIRDTQEIMRTLASGEGKIIGVHTVLYDSKKWKQRLKELMEPPVS